MSYRNQEIWQLAREISIAIHEMTLTELPKFEMFEEGSQIRRSCKSTRINIVEGYGRRMYKQEYIRFLHFSHASNDETIDHLNILWETKSLKNESRYRNLYDKLNVLGRKLNNFIKAVEKNN